MTLIKQIFAWFGLVLGAIGIVISLVVIIGAWWFNDSLTNGLLQIFPPINETLTFGDELLTDFSGFVTDIQVSLEESTDREAVAATLQTETEQVNTYTDMISGAANMVEQVALALVERGPGSTPRLFNAANRLLETLDAIDTTLTSIEELSQQMANGREDIVNALNAELDSLQTDLTAIDVAIDETQTNLAEVESKVPRWIDTGSIIVTLLFVWFGAAQYFLLQSSWHYIRRGQAS